jgi:hypothetical protein
MFKTNSAGRRDTKKAAPNKHFAPVSVIKIKGKDLYLTSANPAPYFFILLCS